MLIIITDIYRNGDYFYSITDENNKSLIYLCINELNKTNSLITPF